MGKQRKRRFHKDAILHSELSGSKQAEQSMAAECIETPVQQVVMKLKESLGSTNKETKICACSSVANFASDAHKELIDAGIVKVIGPLLIDENATLRTNAVGALRNLTRAGGPDVCQQMIKDDVMTPLCALLQKFYGNVSDVIGEKALMDVFEQAIHLLWNLCESSNVALSIFNKQKVLHTLLSALLLPECPRAVSTAIAQCLLTVSEDNEEALSVLRQATVFSSLCHKFRSTEVTLETCLSSVNLAGLIAQVWSPLSENYAGIVKDVVDSLLLVLQQDIASLMKNVLELNLHLNLHMPLNSAESLCVADPVTNASNGNDVMDSGEAPVSESNGQISDELHETQLDEKSEKTVTAVKDLIACQQTALEIIANITCPTDDSDEEWEDVDDINSASDDDVSMDTCDAQPADMDPDSSSLTTNEAFSYLIHSNVIQRVLEKCQACEVLNVDQAASKSHPDLKPLSKSYAQMRCCALLCLSNLVDAMSSADMMDSGDSSLNTGLMHIRDQVSKILVTSLESSDAEISEAASNALRAVCNELEDSSTESSLSLEELTWFSSVLSTCQNTQIRVNILRIVASFGNVLSQSTTLGDAKCPGLKDIGAVFLDVCVRENEVWVLAECLDCIYDVFGSDDHNSVLKELRLVEKLKELLPVYKQKIKEQKRMLGEHKAVINMAITNLQPFIKYKSKFIK